MLDIGLKYILTFDDGVDFLPQGHSFFVGVSEQLQLRVYVQIVQAVLCHRVPQYFQQRVFARGRISENTIFYSFNQTKVLIK